MRYTEARLSPFGDLMLEGVDKLAPMKDNFDNTDKEPITLASYFPNLLCNPQNGIAVGLATKLAPHYAKDVFDAILKVIKDTINNKDTSIDEIIRIIKAPDFPSGGIITNGSDMAKIYKNGYGPVTIRSKYNIEKNSIIYYEIPYKVTPRSIIQSIKELEIPDIQSVRDETSLTGLRIVVELKKDANPEWVINKLFKDTQLQTNFSVNMTTIMNNRPVQNADIKSLILYYLGEVSKIHQKSIEISISELERKIFINDTMLKAIDFIKDILSIIQKDDDPIQSMMDKLEFSREEAEYIYEIKLSSLSKASKIELEEKKKNFAAEHSRLKSIVETRENFLTDLYNKIKSIRDNKVFKNDKRLTEITDISSKNSDDMKLFVKNEPIVVTYSNKGMIKSVSQEEYKAAHRGAKGVKTKLRDDEYILQAICMNTHTDILLVSDIGKIYLLPAYKIPISSRSGTAKSINNYISLSDNESIIMFTKIPEDITDQSLVFVTINGIIKRTLLEILVRGAKNSTGTKAIVLNEGDKIASASICEKNSDMCIFTNKGRGLKFNIDDETKPIRCMGKAARGVMAIKLKPEECVVTAARLNKDGAIFLVTNQGFGKKIEVKSFKVSKRNQAPINYMAKIDKVGLMIGAVIVDEDEDMLLTTQKGQVARIDVNSMTASSRTASGLILMKFIYENDTIVSAASLKKEKKSEDDLEEDNIEVEDNNKDGTNAE